MNDETTTAIRIAISDAMDAASRGGEATMFDQSYGAYQAARDALDGDHQLPTLVDGEVVEDLLRGHSLLVEVLGSHDDLEAVRVHKHRILWRTTAWKSGGLDIAGTCSAVKERERDLYGVVPVFELTLNLAWWLSLDQHGRERELHHQLRHACTGKGHPVEEHPGTVARFGLGNRAQALLVVEAMTRPDCRESLERLLRDDDPMIPGWLP